MKVSVLWVVESSIKRFFPPSKGNFQVLEEDEFRQRLAALDPAGDGLLLVGTAGSESFRRRIREGVRPHGRTVILWEEASPDLRREALTLLEKDPAPGEIESLSMATISSLIRLSSFPEEAHPLILRLIHASGDPDLAETLVLHPRAVGVATSLLREGKSVVVDVEMVASGVNRRRLEELGGRLFCAVAEGGHPPPGHTRTAYGMEKLLREHPEIGVVAVGNAPTALLAALRVLEESPRPVMVIGFPVGFVRAAEAKLVLIRSSLPHLTNYGSRGGSALAAAAVNALLRMAHGAA